MANITYDGQSFFIGGKRIWIVSAALHYPRIPRELWTDRIRAAKQAGCNTIETYVFWNAHEPEPGTFDWSDNLDLRAFVELIHEQDMYAIVRPGPYVCSEWDFGGLPAWLHEQEDIALRQANPAFVQATARYLSQVMEQIRDLQVTVNNGPVIIVQNENEWFCHNDEAATGYLDEINRHLREGGCTVPIINCNNLWQQVENTIDCWNGWRGIFQDMRQLRLARPDQPRFITELWPGWFDAWGRDHERGKSPNEILRRICEVAAAGAQFNLYMFHGGTNFGFWGGRTVGAPDHYMITSYDYDAPLMEAGGRGRKYLASKRICTFLSQFDWLMAHLKPDNHPAAINPGSGATSVVQQTGSMGNVTFVLRDQPYKAEQVDVVTATGHTVNVHFGEDSAAWFVDNLKLPCEVLLNRTNLRPWALPDDRLLVLYGPAGTDAYLSLDSVELRETVPTGWTPKVVDHRGLRIVILNEQQVDAAYLTADQRVMVGAGGLDTDDQPTGGASKKCTIISPEGEPQTCTPKAAPKPRKLANLTDWQHAPCTELIDGSAHQFAPLDGPRPLERCGADYGYGWYRVRMTGVKGKHALLLPEANDRIHLYQDSKLLDIAGFAAGANDEPINVNWTDGDQQLVLLADNLGRYNYGQAMGESKGVFGDVHAVAPIKLGRVKVSDPQPIDPFQLNGYVYHNRQGVELAGPRHTFTVNHRKVKPLIVETFGNRPKSVLLVNDEPVAIDPGANLTCRYVLDPDQHLKRGNNEITFAQFEPAGEGFRMSKCVRAYEALEVLSADAEWAYARWEQPADDAFTDLPDRGRSLPTWYRTSFSLKQVDAPLFLEINRMSKGQIYLNGRNVGRYFVATATGKKVPPQDRYYLPEPWLNVDGDNELILFDEHGKRPDKCRLVTDPLGPFGDWKSWDKP